jgi:hypothetical protein
MQDDDVEDEEKRDLVLEVLTGACDGMLASPPPPLLMSAKCFLKFAFVFSLEHRRIAPFLSQAYIARED